MKPNARNMMKIMIKLEEIEEQIPDDKSKSWLSNVFNAVDQAKKQLMPEERECFETGISALIKMQDAWDEENKPVDDGYGTMRTYGDSNSYPDIYSLGWK